MKQNILTAVILSVLIFSLSACSMKGSETEKSTGDASHGETAAPDASTVPVPETTAPDASAVPVPETEPLTTGPDPVPETEPDTFNGADVITAGRGNCLIWTRYDPYDQPSASGAASGDAVRVLIFSGANREVLTGNSDSFALQKDSGGQWTNVLDRTGSDASVSIPRDSKAEQTADCSDLFTRHGDGHYRVIKRLSVNGSVQYHASDFYVLKTSDPARLQKSEYTVNPREELVLTARFPSAAMEQSPAGPQPLSLDITLSLLKDTGIDPICGTPADHIIEEQIGGVWYTIPRPGYFITLEGYVPEVDKPVNQEVSLSGTVQHPGHYRILKRVIIGRGAALTDEYYAAEFDVPAD